MQSAYLLQTCELWPVRDPGPFTGPYTGEGVGPVLVIGGALDSQTPYPWALAMTEALDDAVDTYLASGAVPAPGTVCVQDPQPPRRCHSDDLTGTAADVTEETGIFRLDRRRPRALCRSQSVPGSTSSLAHARCQASIRGPTNVDA